MGAVGAGGSGRRAGGQGRASQAPTFGVSAQQPPSAASTGRPGSSGVSAGTRNTAAAGRARTLPVTQPRHPAARAETCSGYGQSGPASRTAAVTPRSSPGARGIARRRLGTSLPVSARRPCPLRGNRAVCREELQEGRADGRSLAPHRLPSLPRGAGAAGCVSGRGGGFLPRGRSDVDDIMRGHTRHQLKASLLSPLRHVRSPPPPPRAWQGQTDGFAGLLRPRAGRSHPGLQRQEQGFLNQNHLHAHDSACAHLTCIITRQHARHMHLRMSA